MAEISVWYLIAQSLIELLFWGAVALISIPRLRSMSWPVGLVALYIPVWLFSSRNLVIYDVMLNKSKGLEGEWLLWLPVILFSVLIFLGVMLISIPGAKQEIYNSA
jgi:hypothetical protein